MVSTNFQIQAKIRLRQRSRKGQDIKFRKSLLMWMINLYMINSSKNLSHCHLLYTQLEDKAVFNIQENINYISLGPTPFQWSEYCDAPFYYLGECISTSQENFSSLQAFMDSTLNSTGGFKFISGLDSKPVKIIQSFSLVMEHNV